MGAYALAREGELQGTYHVFCTDCHKQIGTMTGLDVQRAIMATKDRGGLKCPKCRTDSCPRCHMLLEDCGGMGASGVCRWCEDDHERGVVTKPKQVYLEVTLV